MTVEQSTWYDLLTFSQKDIDFASDFLKSWPNDVSRGFTNFLDWLTNFLEAKKYLSENTNFLLTFTFIYLLALWVYMLCNTNFEGREDLLTFGVYVYGNIY